MAEALLITQSDIKALTNLNGNVDTDKIIPHIKTAQDIHLTRLLGSRLINKIKADIIASTLAGDYLTLVNDYCKNVLIHYTMAEFLPYLNYTLSNKGIYKHSAENSENATKEEIDFLCEKERTLAQYYAERLTDYLCYNTTLFPEYSQAQNDEIPSQSNEYRSGWVI